MAGSENCAGAPLIKVPALGPVGGQAPVCQMTQCLDSLTPLTEERPGLHVILCCRLLIDVPVSLDICLDTSLCPYSVSPCRICPDVDSPCLRLRPVNNHTTFNTTLPTPRTLRINTHPDRTVYIEPSLMENTPSQPTNLSPSVSNLLAAQGYIGSELHYAQV